jgi:hypothetical protein
LATILDAHCRKGRWIDMLQDFILKILHKPRLKHMNIDVLNRNPVGPPTNDDDFSEEIQDIGGIQTNTLGAKDDILFV